MASKTVLAEYALLPSGWQKNVLIEWDSNGCITGVHENRDVHGEKRAERFAIMIPGMPNVHSHAFQRAMAGLTEYRANPSDSFWTWRDLMYRFAAQLNPDQVQAIAAQLYSEMLCAGFTSVAEFHYLHHAPGGEAYADRSEMSQRIVAAAEHSGIGLTHLPVLYRYAGFGDKTPRVGQQRFLHDSDNYGALLQQLSAQFKHKRHVLGIAPHSLRAVNKSLLDEAVMTLRSLDDDAPIHIHIAEQTAEVNECLAHTGARPVAWLLAHQNVDKKWCLVHATHLDDNEVNALAACKAVAGICTTTEANLGDGFFRVGEFLQRGGVIGVGSDSHISVSAVEELRWLEYGARLQKRERALCCDEHKSVGRFLYEQCLQGGAQALGQAVGDIRVGAYADLVALDDQHPLLVQKHGDAILDSYLFAGNQGVVKDVFVSGEQVVKDRQHRHHERIARDFRRVMRELLSV